MTSLQFVFIVDDDCELMMRVQAVGKVIAEA